MSSSPAEIVLAFLESGENGDESTRKGFEEYVADDIRWVQSGLPTCHTRDECLALWDHFSESTGCAFWPVEVVDWAARGDTVFVERIDHILDKDRKTIADVPIVGVFRLRDGKIIEWLEYFDPTPFSHS